MAKLDQVLQQARLELGAEFVTTDVVGLDGLSIGGISLDPNADTTAASARFAMVTKLSSKVTEKLGLGPVQANMTTTDAAYILAPVLGDGAYYWGLFISREATLGNVRMIVSEYAEPLWDAIPH